MEYRYYRDLKHSYMVCKCDDNAENKDAKYQLKILESGRVKGLLKSNIRAINQENYLYYDVSSMINIADRYATKGLDQEQLIKLLTNMKEMMESLSEFLMGDEGIVLSTKNVFVNLSSGDYNFMYYPYLQERSTYEEFAEELLDIVDHDDDKAVEIIYELCDLAHIKEMMFLEVLGKILEGYKSNESKEKSDQNVSSRNVEIQDDFDFGEEEDEIQVNEPVKETRMERANRKLSAKVQMIFFFMFAAVIAGIMYVRMNYILTKEENLLSIGIMLVSGITGAVALLGAIKTMRTSSAKADTKEEISVREEIYDDYDDYEDDYEPYKTPVKVTSATNGREESVSQHNIEDVGETMLLDEEYEKEMTLYSRNYEKTIRICLNKLPLTIGKMDGCVDMVIPDKSISRMHCKFIKDQLGIALIDLGSTNGCFHNGLRIPVQKKTYLEEGDEIKLGRICFDLR